MSRSRARRSTASHLAANNLGDTLILETRFECSDGIVTLVDFMPHGRNKFERGPARGRGARQGGNVRPARDPLRLWRDRPLGHAARRRHVARRCRAGHGGAAHAGRPHRPEHEDHQRVRGRCRREGAVRAHLRALAPAAASAGRRPVGARGHGRFLDQLVRELPARRRLLRRGPAVADHAQSLHLPADRRHGRRRRPHRCRSNWAG